jgi:Zn ribbon nucleic-acid-binding protein
MNKKRTTEQFKQELYELLGDEYTVLGEYVDTHTKLLIRHNTCGHNWEVRPKSILHRGDRCPHCRKEKQWKSKIKTHEQFCKVIEELTNHEYSVVGTYTGLGNQVLIRHNLCNTEYYITPLRFFRGSRCLVCKKKEERKIKLLNFKKQVYELVKDEYIILGQEYINSHTKILMRHNCNDCNNYEFYMTPKDFLQGYRCPKCAGSIKLTTEEFKQKVYDLVGDEYTVIGEYINCKTKITIRHNICNNEFEMTPNSFLCGQRCVKCQNRNYIKTTEEYKEEVKNKYNDEYEILGEYISNKIKIKTLHKRCGNIFYISPNSLLRNHGCPRCASSKGEKIISKYLNKNNIIFTPQFKIEDCKDQLPLPFDFAIFDNKNKLKYLIEYDGEQHFRPIKYFGGKKKLKIQQYHDELKNIYCNIHNIKLLRIPYWDFDNIEHILNDSLV